MPGRSTRRRRLRLGWSSVPGRWVPAGPKWGEHGLEDVTYMEEARMDEYDPIAAAETLIKFTESMGQVREATEGYHAQLLATFSPAAADAMSVAFHNGLLSLIFGSALADIQAKSSQVSS